MDFWVKQYTDKTAMATCAFSDTRIYILLKINQRGNGR